MSLGSDIVALGKQHVGERYVFGARAKFTDKNFKGPWDCAEFTTWVVYQATGETVLLGCSPREPTRGDAYTGFWYDDAVRFGLITSVADALRTQGAMLLRRPARSRIGHIAISLGNRRQTVEAKDAQSGIVIGKADPDLRGWEFGVRIPTAQEWATLTRRASAPDNWFLREVTSRVEDPRVAEVQLSLSKKRAWSKPITGVFGAETSKSIAEFQKKQNLVVDGMVGAQTSRALGINWNKIASASGTYNAKYDVFFDALVPGKFYSSDPDILSVKRSIRTNNPGALNFSAWQRSMKGYVSLTPPDSAGNRTTIYRTPEHGVAAWYELIANRYGFGQAGSFTLAQLARKYAGPRASQQAVNTYVQGWSRASGGALTADTIFRTASDSEMLALGRAMFFHEIGRASPLHDDQVRYGIQKQRAKSMPD